MRNYTSKTGSLFFHLMIAAVAAYFVNIWWRIDLPYAWIICANGMMFLSFGWDKLRSMKQWRRTPETTYLIIALLGAFPGLFLGRKIFNHKTSKASFIIPMWILFFGQIIASAFWLGDTDTLLAELEKEKLRDCTVLGTCPK